jgi:hypothetical protein
MLAPAFLSTFLLPPSREGWGRVFFVFNDRKKKTLTDFD